MGEKTYLAVILFCLSFNGCLGQNLSLECDRDWNRTIHSLQTERWARYMFDAMGKPEAGIMDGNYVFEGDYRECVNRAVENQTHPNAIKGMYCMATWYYISEAFKQGYGMCIPHTCTDEDARLLLFQIAPSMIPPNSQNAYVECRRTPDLSSDPAAIVSIVILSIFGLLVIAATTFDVIYQKHVVSKKPLESSGIAAVVEANGIPTTNGHVPGKHTNLYVNGDLKPNSFPGDSKTGIANGALVQERESNKEDGTGIAVITTPDNTHKFVQASDSSIYGTKKEECKRYNVASADLEKLKQKEQVKKPSVLVRCALVFSLYQNVPRLVAAKHHPASYPCLNGIRFLSMCWVFLGHTYSISLTTIVTENRWPIVGALDVWHIDAIFQGILSVDVFFMLSGLLVTVSFLKALKRQGKVTCKMMGLYYFHRYWRLTPVYAIALMINANLFGYFGNGPFFSNAFKTTMGCDGVIWRHLLYIQNLWPSKEIDVCFNHDWYLCNDMQFYVMAPAFLVIAYYYPKPGFVLMIAGYCGSLTAGIVIFSQLNEENNDMDHFTDYYVRPWTRAVTYFIGMMLGFILFHTSGKKITIHKGLVVLGWLVSLALINLAVYGVDIEKDKAGTVAFSSLQSTMFITGMAWLIFACVHGYGGFINAILSWRAFIPLCRLTYTGYLIHIMFLMYYVAISPQQIYFYYWNLIYLFVGHVVIVLGASAIMTLVFEIPLAGLEKVMIPQKK